MSHRRRCCYGLGRTILPLCVHRTCEADKQPIIIRLLYDYCHETWAGPEEDLLGRGPLLEELLLLTEVEEGGRRGGLDQGGSEASGGVLWRSTHSNLWREALVSVAKQETLITYQHFVRWNITGDKKHLTDVSKSSLPLKGSSSLLTLTLFWHCELNTARTSWLGFIKLTAGRLGSARQLRLTGTPSTTRQSKVLYIVRGYNKIKAAVMA